MKINFKKLNQYLKDNPSKNTCRHSTTNIVQKEFTEIGDLYDSSYGKLSYLALKPKNKSEEIIGTYPLQDCKILECSKCKQVVFFRLNSGGVAPRPEFFLANYTKDYITEPAVQSVFLKKAHLEQFINTFQLEAQLKNANKGFENHISIEEKEKRYIFNYREFENQKDQSTSVNFDLVGQRKWLEEVKRFLEREFNE